MSKISCKSKEKHFKSIGEHKKFLQRISKSLYYGKLPSTERLSLPVTEMAADIFSEVKTGKSLDRLHCNDAAKISRNACVSPCSLVLAMLYLERLKACNPEYLQRIVPSELFLVSLMVSSKFLHDDGEEDEVFVDEWASSGNMSVKNLIQLEKEFLDAIQWEVFVNEHTFWRKLKELETILAKKQGVNRGWFTYTELNNLLTTIDIYNLVQYVSSLITILMATYAVGILTILGSVFIVSHVPGNCLQTRTIRIDENNKTHVSIQSEETESTLDASAKLAVVTLEAENDFYDSFSQRTISKHLDAADVLKTGIFLASLKAQPITKPNSNKSQLDFDESTSVEENIEYVTWDWWSSSVMQWLTETSKLVKNFDFTPDVHYFTYNHYIDMSIAGAKKITLEDQIHKATKLRLQDQLESSWHEEWTDLFKRMLYVPNSFSYYFQNYKS